MPHRLPDDDGSNAPSQPSRFVPLTSVIGSQAQQLLNLEYISVERKRTQVEKYRFTKRFGSTVGEVFAAVKNALLELVNAGAQWDFEAIDDNPLSQTFKAKILSLYFSDKFMNVCSQEHIEALAEELGIADNLYLSEKQHLLLEAKLENPITKKWSNPKTMTFLYNTYIREPSERVYFMVMTGSPSNWTFGGPLIFTRAVCSARTVILFRLIGKLTISV